MTQVENTVGDIAASKPRGRLRLALLTVVAIAGIALLVLLYFQVILELIYTWVTKPDYSHSILVPFFSAFLLWRRRKELREMAGQSPDVGKLRVTGLIVSGLVLRLVGLVIGSPWFARISLIPIALGLTTIKWGRGISDLARPAILFLVFMIPLPDVVANLFNAFQDVIVTYFSSYGLQTLGVPAITVENVIVLTDGQIDASQGGRGIYLFLALVVGACLISDRMRVEKVILLVSVIPICIVANSLGVIATGVAHEFFGAATAQQVFRVSGWLMLPVGLLLVCGVFFILNRLYVPDD